MAWHDTTVGVYYRIGSTEAIDNAWEIYAYFRNLSTPWAIESIAAMCGNMQTESQMNPYVRETTQSGAFGLVQWITHKRDMISWAQNQGMRATSGPAQVAYIEQERQGIDDQWLGRHEFVGMRMSEFAYNSRNFTVSKLSYCWWDCFERSAEYQQQRGRDSATYYELFTGSPPPGDEQLPIWLMRKRRWWYMGGRRYV